MTETLLRIKGQDDTVIWGKLCAEGHRRLVIHIHGLTHQMNFLLEVTSSEFFNANGFDHYRVGLYEGLRGSRRLHESTLSTHTKDIQSVLDHFCNSYDEIFITAHSLGGLAMLILNPKNICAMSLWDPALDVTNFWKTGDYLTPLPEQRQYALNYGNVFVLSADMVEEMKKYPDDVCLDLARAVVTPMQFVIPERSIFDASPHTSPENYASAFGGAFDLRRITDAPHTFSNRGNREVLFKASLDWFNQHRAIQ